MNYVSNKISNLSHPEYEIASSTLNHVTTYRRILVAKRHNNCGANKM